MCAVGARDKYKSHKFSLHLLNSISQAISAIAIGIVGIRCRSRAPPPSPSTVLPYFDYFHWISFDCSSIHPSTITPPMSYPNVNNPSDWMTTKHFSNFRFVICAVWRLNQQQQIECFFATESDIVRCWRWCCCCCWRLPLPVRMWLGIRNGRCRSLAKWRWKKKSQWNFCDLVEVVVDVAVIENVRLSIPSVLQKVTQFGFVSKIYSFSETNRNKFACHRRQLVLLALINQLAKH